MATGQYESFGFTEAKGSVPASVVIGARGERKINALSSLDRSIYIIGILNSYIENLQESRISVDDTKRVLQSRAMLLCSG